MRGWPAHCRSHSPEVKNAADIIGQALVQGWVRVRRSGCDRHHVLWRFSRRPVHAIRPNCWLHRQANFITSFFPPEAKPDVDYDVFYLPPIDPQYGKPFLVAGDIYAMFNDKPEVRALMEYFTLPMSVSGFLKTGGAFAAAAECHAGDVQPAPLDGEHRHAAIAGATASASMARI